MSSIEKLLIRGIRSFDPDQAAVIEFYSPVTLIVGHNGAGKTTIIECLKYATTGDLPPNAKGGAFVHDPKLAGEGEVKGQVKLKFRNVRGQSMVITRSLQSTMKRGGKIEQKTLEGLLVTTDPVTGEQVSISSRCAELDAEIPMQLGVSRAILESVIFCHQEDSHWPLSEPSLLKKRFDDLFAATRYTKALEALKGTRKDLMAELKLEQQKLEYLKGDREKAVKLESALLTVDKQIVECRARVEVYNRDIGELNQELTQVTEHLTLHSSTVSELERMRHELTIVSRTVNDLQQVIGTELTEDDAQLQAILDQHTLIVSNRQGELVKEEAKKYDLQTQLNAKQQFLNSLLSEQGLVIALIEAHEAKKTELASYFGEIVRELALGELECKAENIALVDEAFTKLSNTVADRRRKYSDKFDTFNAETTALQSKKSALEESKKVRRREVDEQRQRLLETMKKLEELEADESAMNVLKQRVVDEELAAHRTHDFLEAGNYQAKISEMEQRKSRVDEEIRSCNHRIGQYSVQAETRAKVDLKRTELRRKNELIDQTLGEIKSDLKYFNISLNEQEDLSAMIIALEVQISETVKGHEKSAKECNERIDALNTAVSVATSKYEHIGAIVKERQTRIEMLKARISKAIGDDDFDFLLHETEARYRDLLEQAADSASHVSLYDSFLDTLQLHHACPLCDRSFTSKLEEATIVQRLTRQRANTAMNANKDNLLEVERKLNGLKDVKVAVDELKRITEVELPALKEELEATEHEQERTKANLRDLRSEHTCISVDEKKAQGLKRKVDETVRMARDWKCLREDVIHLERQLRLSDAANIDDSLDDLQSALKRLEEERRRLSVELEMLMKDHKQKQNDAQRCSERFRDLKEELMQLQLRQSEKLSLQSAKIETELAILQSEKASKEIDDDLRKLDQEIEKVRAKNAKVLEELRQELHELESHFDKVRMRLTLFESLQKQIKDDPSDRLASVNSQINEANQTILDLQFALSQVDERLTSFRQGTAELQTKERLLRDNLTLRSHRRKIAQLTALITELEQRLNGFDVSAALNKQHRLQLGLSDRMGERSGLAGELKQLEEQATRLRRELSTDYPNTEIAYREQLIRVEASQLATEDLDRYARALDQAIMRYHASKMDEVNRSLRDLWSAVYTGTDIDAVEIRADQEGSAAVTTRSYNYRVVMIKSGVEMDMRGRSSAGQRVLTSLLIRLALSDTFAAHCGIFALDEPTTNLDRANIMALAEALADLIRARRQQANFQLLIITHDEEFVEALARHECAEYYWRVGRDQRQHSIIERQSLSMF